MKTPERTFTHSTAVRKKTPLFVGIVGCTGSGKTVSSLRVASGIARIDPGPIFFLDTESNRALAYASDFVFEHVPFLAPFSPLDYLSALEHCVENGARTVIIDSMTHEHTGPGGVLEWHEAEVERMSGGDPKKAERVKLSAWQKPKAARQRLIDRMLQLQCNVIMNFRAKERIKPNTGGQPIDLGWQIVGGEEFGFECALCCLLPPGSDGTPEWKPEQPAERQLVKLPRQFRTLFANSPQLSEDIGERLARWAAGGSADGPATARTETAAALLLRGYETAATMADKGTLDAEVKAAWGSLNKAERAALLAARDAATARLAPPTHDPSTGEVDESELPEPGSAG